jgi:hypothetical protein
MTPLQKKRLKKELKLLQKSFDAGLITKVEYLRGKEKLEKKLYPNKNSFVKRSVRVTKKVKKAKPKTKKKKTKLEIFTRAGPVMSERTDLWKASTLVLGFLLVVSILSYGFRGAPEEMFLLPEAEEAPVVELENEIVFLNSNGCTSLCDEMEPKVRELAERLGLGFRTMSYFQPVPIPGYVFVYNEKVQVGGMRNYDEFVQEVCYITKDSRVC